MPTGAEVIIDQTMMPTVFASSRPLQESELSCAPVRYPRPSRLTRPLELDGPKAAKAATALGLNTVADLLEHLPRDRREARAVAQLAAGETATVVVQVRSIASRPVRRRGMRPLVEATVADGSGSMKATFFNQPWLLRKYPAGTRLVLHGKYEARNRFRVQAHARTTEAATGTDGSHIRRQRRALLHPDPRARARPHQPDRRGARAIAGFAAHRRAASQRRSAVAAAHFEGDQEQALGRRRLAFDELLLAQLALLRRRRLRRSGVIAPVLDQPRELTARWLATMLPFSLTGDQQAAIAQLDHDLAQPRPMQRLLMGEVGSGKTVVALYGLLRAIEHGYQGA